MDPFTAGEWKKAEYKQSSQEHFLRFCVFLSRISL